MKDFLFNALIYIGFMAGFLTVVIGGFLLLVGIATVLSRAWTRFLDWLEAVLPKRRRTQ